MKNKKEFFGVLFSVLISVFLVFLAAYAVTTVGDDINVDTGKLIAGHDAIMEHALQVGHTATMSAGHSAFGNGTTGHSLADNDDVLFVGLVEFDDVAYFDSTVSLSDSGTLRVANIVGHTDSGQYLRIGDITATGHSLNADDDLLVNGDMEVDGTAFFDGTASISAMDFSSGLVTAAMLQAGSGTTSAAYSRFGISTTGHSEVVSASSDLLISDALEVDGTAFFDGAVSVSNTTTAISTGGTAIEWDGSTEWMRIFLENQDTTPGSSGIVMSLINNASITSGDQITLELKGDIADGTTFAAGGTGHLTTLRARVEFKGESIYTDGNVQPINAVLGSDSGVTLTGSALRAGNFRVRLGSDPGHAEILLLENDCVTDESFLDTFITFHGGGAQSAMEFGPGNNTTSWKGATSNYYDLTDQDQPDAIIKVKIGSTYFWIPAYDAASVDNE